MGGKGVEEERRGESGEKGSEWRERGERRREVKFHRAVAN